MVKNDPVVFYSDLRSGLNYHCIDSAIVKALEQADDFKLEYHISDKNFKHVEDKLILHNLFNNILEILRKETVNPSFKRVLYISEDFIRTKTMKSPVLIKQLRVLKKILPIPFIVPLSNDAFLGMDGRVKELNSKCLEFYKRKKIKLKELKRYFNDKGYKSLTATLSGTVNLKGLYY
jgi:hypothetical protein